MRCKDLHQQWGVYLYPGLTWLVGTVVWMYVVGRRVDWENLEKIGQFGDAMAPVALLGALLGLILTTVSVRTQREDFKAQLQEMKDATRFQSRREIYDSIDRLMDRISQHLSQVTELANTRGVWDWTDENKIAAEVDAESETDALTRGKHLMDLETFKLFSDAVAQGTKFQRELSNTEADLYASSGVEEPPDRAAARTELFKRAVAWLSKGRERHLMLKEPHAFLSYYSHEKAP